MKEMRTKEDRVYITAYLNPDVLVLREEIKFQPGYEFAAYSYPIKRKDRIFPYEVEGISATITYGPRGGFVLVADLAVPYEKPIYFHKMYCDYNEALEVMKQKIVEYRDILKEKGYLKKEVEEVGNER